MTDIYSKKCKNAFWPLFALAVLCCRHVLVASSPCLLWRWFWGRGQCLGALCGSTCTNWCNQRSKSLKKSSIRKGSWRQLFSSRVSWRSRSHSVLPLLRGSFLLSDFLLASKLLGFEFCVFLVSPSEKDKYFHSLCIVHNLFYFNQFSNSRFLKEAKYCRTEFNMIRLSSKIPTNPNPKSTLLTRYISTSCFPCIGLITKNRNSRLLS